MRILTQIQDREGRIEKSVIETPYVFFDIDGINFVDGTDNKTIYSCAEVDSQKFDEIADILLKNDHIDLTEYVISDCEYVKALKNKGTVAEQNGKFQHDILLTIVVGLLVVLLACIGAQFAVKCVTAKPVNKTYPENAIVTESFADL